MFKKKKPSPFDLQPQLNQSKQKKKIQPPIILSIAMVVGWLSYKVICIVNYCTLNNLSFINYLTPQELLWGSIPLSLDKKAIMVAGICAFIAVMACVVSNDQKKKTRTGAEHGSAQFSPKDASLPFRDPNVLYNTIFSENELFSLNDAISQRNRNVLMLGSPGTGKSRFVYKPNLLNKTEDETIFVSDPKGELLESCGYALKQADFDIRVLDLAEPRKSDHFNVFEYVPFRNKQTNEVKRHLTEEEFLSRQWEPESAEVMTIIDGIMKNTSTGDNKSGDPFWDNCTQLELSAIFFYVLCNLPLHRQNFGELMNISRMADASKKGLDNPLNRLFNEWELGELWVNKETNKPIKANMPLFMALTEEEKAEYTVDKDGYVHKKEWVNQWGITMHAEPEAFGVKQWKSLVVGAGSEKTMATVLLCMQSRLNLIDVPEINTMLSSDEMRLDDIGFSKIGRKAYFIVSSPSRQAFMWFGALFYTVAFQMLEDNAKKQPGKRNAIPIDFYLDELANIGTIPQLIKQMTLVRGYNAGVFAGLQSLTQLKNMYKDEWEVFLDACNYILFLGSQSSETLKYISEMLGKETIITNSGSKSYGKSNSMSGSWQSSQRELLTIDELRSMPKGYCILLDAGVRVKEGTAYYSKLYELKSHPRAHLLYDAPRNVVAGQESEGKNYYNHAQYQSKRNGCSEYLKACGVDTDKVKLSGWEMTLPFEQLNEIQPGLFIDFDEFMADPEVQVELAELKNKVKIA